MNITERLPCDLNQEPRYVSRTLGSSGVFNLDLLPAFVLPTSQHHCRVFNVTLDWLYT